MTTLTRPLHVPDLRHHVAPVVTGVALLAGAGVGVLAWSRQLAGGLAETGLNGVVPWGLYSVLFTCFVSASAGALAVACAGVLRPRAWLAGLVRPASAVAVAAAAAAVLAVVVNLARPERVANLMLHPHWAAPLVWQLYGLLVALALAAVLALACRRRAVRARPVRVLSWAGALVAIALPVLAAWVFTFPPGQATWDDPLLSPTLLASSTTSGVALAALAGLAFAARSHGVTTPVRGLLGTALLAAVGATFLLTTLGYVTALTSGARERALVEVVLPGGTWQWVFWTQWPAGILAVVLLAVPRLRRIPAGLGVAAAAATVATSALVAGLVASGAARPPVSLPPGTGTGRWAPDAPSFVQVGSYSPSWTEYGVAVGLLAVFLAVVLLAHGSDVRGDRA